MKKWILMATVGAMAVSVWAQPPCAGMGPKGPGPGAGRGQGRGIGPAGAILHDAELADSVGLTADQVKAVREAAYELRKETIKLGAQKELADLEVNHIQQAEKLDAEALKKAIDAAGAAATELEKAETLGRLNIQSLIGDDKIEAIQAAIREKAEARRGDQMRRRDERRDRRGRGMGPGCPMQDDDDDQDDDQGGGEPAAEPND